MGKNRFLILVGFLLLSILGFGQSDFSAIDERSKSVPDSLVAYNDIAVYLTDSLNTDVEKARALYVWIAHNIEYDLSRMNSSKRYLADQDIIDEVLKNRRGVCEHYSQLFLAMSKSVGLKSYLIRGYTRDVFGRIADYSHAWNGIKIDSKYYLIDVTWASGYLLEGRYVNEFRDKYFLSLPQSFIKDHMPFDPIWQFIDNPINNGEFISRDFSKVDTTGGYAFRDSIRQYERYDELIRLETSNKRIINNGVKNKLIKRQVDENILQITNRRFNMAIDTLNYGIEAYNLYVTYKNKQFRRPKVADSRVKELIINAYNAIHAANDILKGLSSSNVGLNNSINEARNRMPKLISDVEREKAFVDKYLKKWKPLRGFMFVTYGKY